MTTRHWIVIVTIAAAVYAGSKGDIAAVYIAIGVGALTFHLHAIEVKVNRLLDHCGITVWDSEIAKE